MSDVVANVGYAGAETQMSIIVKCAGQWRQSVVNIGWQVTMSTVKMSTMEMAKVRMSKVSHTRGSEHLAQ